MRPPRRGAEAATALVVAALLLAGCGAGPLDASEPAEVVLRSVRLAGFEGTVAGSDDAGAYAWLDLPGLDTAADVEIAWQTGFASLAAAYPRADAYRVRVSVSGAPLFECACPGDEARAAVEADDATGLRAAIAFTYLAEDTSSAPPEGALAAGEDTAEAYLEAKNRAAGLVSAGDGTVRLKTAQLEREAERMRAAVSGKPAIAPADALAAYAGRIEAGLDGRAAGEEHVVARVAAAADQGAGPEAIGGLRALASVVEAVSRAEAYGELLGAAAALAGAVGETSLAEGAARDAVLVAAGDPDAPATARAVASFEPEPASDVVELDPRGTLAASALVLSQGVWTDADGVTHRLNDQAWKAYRRADGALFWQGATNSELALTDASVRGWAYTRLRVAVVDAGDVGTVLGSIELPGALAQGAE